MADNPTRNVAATHPVATTRGGQVPDGPGAALTETAQRRWRSSELLGSTREVEIEHGDAVYRLRLTAMGKLILTK